MGVYSTMTLDGWNDELCENVSLSRKLLPEIRESNQVAGMLTREAASDLGLPLGVPVLAGMIDTSAAMLLAGARPGQLLNVCGSTDVLALLTDRPKPHERLITRAFGIGRKWMSVSTLAAAGSAIQWAHDQLFPDYAWSGFDRLVKELARSKSSSSLRFDPFLAGDRMSIEQRKAGFTGLTLATTRREMLKAIIDALAGASAERLPLLLSDRVKPLKRVVVTGRGFDHVLRRDWRGKWRFAREEEATLRGLGNLM
jgi:xylulokinase